MDRDWSKPMSDVEMKEYIKKIEDRGGFEKKAEKKLSDYEDVVPGSVEDEGRHYTKEDYEKNDKMYRDHFGFDKGHPNEFNIDPNEMENNPDPVEPGTPIIHDKLKPKRKIIKTNFDMDDMEAFIFPVIFDNSDNGVHNDFYDEF